MINNILTAIVLLIMSLYDKLKEIVWNIKALQLQKRKKKDS